MSGGLLDDCGLEELERMNGELYEQIEALRNRRKDVQQVIEERKSEEAWKVFNDLSLSQKRRLVAIMKVHGYFDGDEE